MPVTVMLTPASPFNVVSRRAAPRLRNAWRALVAVLVVAVIGGLTAVLFAAGGSAADRQETQPPSVSELERRATEQGFTAIQLLGNDAVGVPGARIVVSRVERAWVAAKRMYLGKPQDPARSRALREVFERWQRRDDQLHGNDKRDDWRVASIRLRLLAPGVSWPGETDRQRRVRVATVLVADRASSKDFWAQVRKAKDDEPSESVKAACGVIALGPGVLGAIGSALRFRGSDQSRQVREACESTGKRVQDTTTTVARTAKDIVTDPLGTLAKGLFGPLLTELQKGASYASKQVGSAIDKVATPDLSERWLRDMLRRAATIAVLIALVAGILGVAHAAITGSLSALASVVGRALLSGVVGSVVLTMLNVGVVFADQLTAIAIGTEAGESGKRFAAFADTATKAMSESQVPSFVALLLLLALLLGLLIVWWEMWLRAPLIYAGAFFYGPAYAASLFPPARQVLGHLNALLAAAVLMPMVVLSLLEMAVASLDGGDTITAVLQALGLVLLAAASPAILVALFSPSVALSAAAGMAGALGTGRAIGRAGRRAATGAASATLGAAAFAKDRLNDTATRPDARGPGATPPSGGGPTGGSGGDNVRDPQRVTAPNQPGRPGADERGTTARSTSTPGMAAAGRGAGSPALLGAGPGSMPAIGRTGRSGMTGGSRSSGPDRGPGAQPSLPGFPAGSRPADADHRRTGDVGRSGGDGSAAATRPPQSSTSGGDPASRPTRPSGLNEQPGGNSGRPSAPRSSREDPPRQPDAPLTDRPPRPADPPPRGGGLKPPTDSKGEPDA